MATLWVKQSSSGVERKSPVVPIEMRQNDWLGPLPRRAGIKGLNGPGRRRDLPLKDSGQPRSKKTTGCSNASTKAQKFCLPHIVDSYAANFSSTVEDDQARSVSVGNGRQLSERCERIQIALRHRSGFYLHPK